MIGVSERKAPGYRKKLKDIVTFTFVRARYGTYRVKHREICRHFMTWPSSDITSFMCEPLLKGMFTRLITDDGIVYSLNARYRFLKFDDVNKELEKVLDKNKK